MLIHLTSALTSAALFIHLFSLFRIQLHKFPHSITHTRSSSPNSSQKSAVFAIKAASNLSGTQKSPCYKCYKNLEILCSAAGLSARVLSGNIAAMILCLRSVRACMYHSEPKPAQHHWHADSYQANELDFASELDLWEFSSLPSLSTDTVHRTDTLKCCMFRESGLCVHSLPGSVVSCAVASHGGLWLMGSAGWVLKL